MMVRETLADRLGFDMQLACPKCGVYSQASCLVELDGNFACATCFLDALRIEEIVEDSWAGVRAERNARLAACDWTQLADVPEETKRRWQDYRQKLRDITTLFGSPKEVVFPDLP